MRLTNKPRGVIIAAYNTSGIQTITVTNNCTGLSVINDSVLTNLVFIVNGITITVKPRETFDDDFEEFNSVRITSNATFRMCLRE